MPNHKNFPHSEVYVVTGSSGTGKSLACKYLEQLGAHIVSADALAKEAVKKGSVGLKKLRETLGDSVLNSNGELNRKELHNLITKDSKIRDQVERILHPIIRDIAEKEFILALNKSNTPVIYDCPLYFEKNLQTLGYKKSILITAPEEVAINRISTRDTISLEVARDRLKIQMPQSEKIKRADIVIENNGTIEDFEKKINVLYLNLKRWAMKGEEALMRK